MSIVKRAHGHQRVWQAAGARECSLTKGNDVSSGAGLLGFLLGLLCWLPWELRRAGRGGLSGPESQLVQAYRALSPAPQAALLAHAWWMVEHQGEESPYAPE